jgi:hypothetical protein
MMLWTLEYLLCLMVSALVVHLVDPHVRRLEAWVENR